MPFFQKDWRMVEVPVYKEKTPTPYTRFGDWFPRLLILVLLGVLAASVVFQKKKSS
jgi:apolipoprotein N-acyltransferase